MRYKSQIITQTLVVESVPTELTAPGATIFVNIPKDLNIFRISIWNDKSSLGVPNSTLGGIGTTISNHVDDFHVLQPSSDDKYPFVMESKNGYIVDGFYLAVLSQTVTDGCVFHILFEGEQ